MHDEDIKNWNESEKTLDPAGSLEIKTPDIYNKICGLCYHSPSLTFEGKAQETIWEKMYEIMCEMGISQLDANYNALLEPVMFDDDPYAGTAQTFINIDVKPGWSQDTFAGREEIYKRINNLMVEHQIIRMQFNLNPFYKGENDEQQG